MNTELTSFAVRLFPLLREPRRPISDAAFNELALQLFALQFKHNTVYQKICAARRLTPQEVEHWTQIPVLPTSAFKDLELTSLPPAARTAVFHSSGTTEQRPSRHFHSKESLDLYEASLISWFLENVRSAGELVCLTPPPAQAPHSSLIHMFETVRQALGQPESVFVGHLDPDRAWTLDFAATIQSLKNARDSGKPLTLLGTAFSFVHLLDYLTENRLQLQLPAGSQVMETGGYKNRSRTMPKRELHALITEQVGVPDENIICEYGMSELSSQAYDSAGHLPASRLRPRLFQFPPWARVRIISPETGREVAEGETGLVQIFDLANVFSVAALQTEDLGIRRDNGFELAGRAQLAEPRGCSLMTV